MHAGSAGFVSVPRPVQGAKVRQRPQSFADHYSQAALFWRSLSPVEQDHVVGAFSFELGKCERAEIRQRMVDNLARIDTRLCSRVAANLGLVVPDAEPVAAPAASPALSQLPDGPGPVRGRMIAVVVGPHVDVAGVEALRRVFDPAGAHVVVVGPHLGRMESGVGALEVDRILLTTQSVEYDAVVVAGTSGGSPAADEYALANVAEAYRHHKPVAGWGDGREALEVAGIDLSAGGVVTAARADEQFGLALRDALGWHRHWDRRPLRRPVGVR
jgi:catalase